MPLNVAKNKAQVQQKQQQADPMKQLGELMKLSMGPYQKGVEKALKESGYNQAVEAIQGGIPAQHVEQESGLNVLNSLMNPQQQATSAPQQNLQQLIKIIASKNALDPGGMEQDSAGNILLRESGWLMRGAPQTAGNDMQRLNALVNMQEVPMRQKEQASLQEYRQLENEMKRKQMEQLNKNEEPMSVEQMFQQMNIPPEQQEDFQVKTTNQNIRGMVVQVPTLERKKTLPAKELTDLSTLQNSHRMMKKNMDFLKEKGLQIGPGLSTRPGALADLLGQMKGTDFNTWKASVGRAFDQYRKWLTGAQASYKEMNWIVPNYPKGTDNAELFIQKTLDVMRDAEENNTNFLNNFSDGGYAVSKLRKNLATSDITQGEGKKYLRTGKNKKGQRVGQLADGTIEVINE